MESFNASDAKREFGDLLLKAQSAPIGINKNGKPVAVVMSAAEYGRLEAYRNEQLRVALQQGLDDLTARRVSDGGEVFGRLRQRIS